MSKDDDASVARAPSLPSHRSEDFAEMLKALRESIEGVNEKIEEMKKELKKKM